MRTVNLEQSAEVANRMNNFITMPLVVQVQSEPQLDKLMVDLISDTSWRNRQIAARKLGCLGSPKALPALIDALSSDTFWMVRCAIVQALETIGDANAVPALREAAQHDGFQIVRSYAEKAVERLSLSW